MPQSLNEEPPDFGVTVTQIPHEFYYSLKECHKLADMLNARLTSFLAQDDPSVNCVFLMIDAHKRLIESIDEVNRLQTRFKL